MAIRVSPEIFARYPGYRATVVQASGLTAGASDAGTLALLRDAERRARGRFASRPVGQHPHIAAWRSAYRDFGAERSVRCSVEALLRRALTGGVPSLLPLVDLYNAVSIEHVLPVGGEDHDRVAGDLLLRVAGGGELFETRDDGQVRQVPVAPGEVVWVDAAGVTCRRWNWRQCLRTALTEQTTSAYFVLDALDPYTDAQLAAATDALVAGLRRLSPGCEIFHHTLRADPDQDVRPLRVPAPG